MATLGSPLSRRTYGLWERKVSLIKGVFSVFSSHSVEAHLVERNMAGVEVTNNRGQPRGQR